MAIDTQILIQRVASRVGLWGAAILIALGTPVALAQPAAIDGVMPQAQEVGSGQFRWWGFRVYDASLWSPSGQYQPGEPFALSLTYARDLDGQGIVQASLDQMREIGLPVDRYPQWEQALSVVLVSVERGDTLTGVYRPGEGAVFFHNDRQTGQIDERLAQAFFAIWLDPNTTAPRLRQALLGQDP
jgi:hypothetical protein